MFVNSTLLKIGKSEASAKLLSWLTLISLPLLMNSSEYARIVLAYSFVMFFFPLVLVGQDRKILSCGEIEIEREFVASSSTVLFMGLGLGLIFFLILVALSVDLVYVWIPLVAIAISLNKLQLCVFRSKDEFDRYSENRLKYSTIRFIAILSTAKIGGTFAYLLSELLSPLIVGQRQFSSFFRKSFDVRVIKNRIIEGLPLAIHGVSGTLTALSDRVVIERYRTLSEVGDYAFCYMLAASVFFVYSVFAVIYEPKIYKSKTSEELRSASSSCLFKMIAAGIIFSGLSFSGYFLSSFFIKDYNHDYVMYAVLALAHVVMPAYYVSNYILIKCGKPKFLLMGTLLAASLNLILNLIFVPIYGSIAAAITTLISNISLCIFLTLFAFNYFKKGFS